MNTIIMNTSYNSVKCLMGLEKFKFCWERLGFEFPSNLNSKLIKALANMEEELAL